MPPTGKQRTRFKPVRLSLADLLGDDYIEAVVSARSFAEGGGQRTLAGIAKRKVNFYPPAFHERLASLLPDVGRRVSKPFRRSAGGAPSNAFLKATNTSAAPLTGFGHYRVGEDGRLYLMTKSAHYHAPVGHSFPGYLLVEHARRLGLPQATHNNTRGHVTRLLEEELVRTANGIERGDRAALKRAVNSKSAAVLNRVLNLETGSLAVEAALKMVLAHFYRPQSESPRPKHTGRIPVILVVGNDDGGLQANYHGTTMLAQTTRDMWPELLSQMSKAGIFRVHAVRPNNTDDLEAAFTKYHKGRHRIAGFFHEIVLMNYGAVLLTKKFLHRAYALCRKHDVPTIVDEIQSCVWNPEMYMFREWGLRPQFVAVGKGLPGGEFPASRILFSGTVDSLPQFGALVTNGQEELASLAYLITMRWAEENAEVTRAVGDRFEQRLRRIAAEHKSLISGIEGSRHMAGIGFHNLVEAKAFTKRLNKAGLDISVQTYKASCPPAALLKLPLTAGFEVVDFVLARIETALAAQEESARRSK